MRLVGRDRRDLEDGPGPDGRTPYDTLRRVAVGDWAAATTLHPRPTPDTGQSSGRIEEALHQAHDARAALLSAYARATDTAAAEVVEIMGERAAADAAAAARLGPEGTGVGPASVLAAAMRGARKELLTVIALFPATARPDLTGDLAPIARDEGRLLSVLTGDRPAEASSWAEQWHGLHKTHQELMTRVEGLTEEELSRAVGVASVYGRLGRIAYADMRLATLLRRRL